MSIGLSDLCDRSFVHRLSIFFPFFVFVFCFLFFFCFVLFFFSRTADLDGVSIDNQFVVGSLILSFLLLFSPIVLVWDTGQKRIICPHSYSAIPSNSVKSHEVPFSSKVNFIDNLSYV